MKKLPIGKQDLASLINDNFIYVDKTEIIHKLISTGVAYFLSRPRRFGKSLTVSALNEIFSGNKELFKGLWIYDKIDWKKYPVIHIDFSKIGVKELGTEKAILKALDEIAKENDSSLISTTVGQKFEELIKAMAGEKQVVILIDEYDKPIIDYLEDIPKAEENREILKNFYSVLKGNDKYIKFLFITGVSKFSKVSVFSDMNHLDDITLNKNYGCLTGYTEYELDTYFSEYLDLAHNELKDYFTNVRQAIKNWYNGYSWNGTDYVYNPFSMLGFFSNLKFEGFWFKTGTPTFLTKLIRSRDFNVDRLEGIAVSGEIFDKYDLSNLELISLLFQTGYLTIKSYNFSTQEYTLGYPNNEVRSSFNIHLLSEFSNRQMGENAILLTDIRQSLLQNDLEKFILLLKVLFKNITYPIIRDKEHYYHSVFYLAIKLLGFEIETEILTCDGRMDAVLKTGQYIYIVEFKIGAAQPAMEQIQKKQYHLKYLNDGKHIVLLGIGFDTDVKNIGGYLIADVN